MQCRAGQGSVATSVSRSIDAGWGDTGGHSWPGAVVTTPDFEARAREMLASDICVGLQTAVHGMMVWIADKHARRRQDLLISFDKEAGTWDQDETASEWIHATALELFPDSPYARRHLRLGKQRRD
jgi:hypothetical protein